MRKSPFNANLLGVGAVVVTFIIVIIALFYLLGRGPLGYERKSLSERLEERHPQAPWEHMERMLRRHYPEMFEERFWEDMWKDWEEQGREFDRDFWEWLERRFEEYMDDEEETERI